MTVHQQLGLVAATIFTFATMTTPSSTQSSSRASGITDVPGIKVGHYTLPERPTGCTVVLADCSIRKHSSRARWVRPWSGLAPILVNTGT